MQGKNEEAILHWEKALLLNPTDVGAYSKLADLYYETNQFKHYLTRGKLKFTEGKATHAISDFKKAVENSQNNKDTLEATFLLAQMYEITNKTDLAIEEYTKMLNIEDNVNVYFKLGELYEKEDRNIAAEKLKQGVEKFPDSLLLNEKLAIILNKLNKPNEALEYAQSFETKAKSYLLQNENNKALEEINKIGVKTEAYLSLLSEYYFNTESFEDCLKTIEELEKVNGLNPLPYQMKALVYEEKNDKLNSALNWGRCYLLQDKKEMALSEFLQAHSLDKKNTKVIEDIINLYENMNEKYPALEFAEKLIKLEPENVSILKKIAKHSIEEGDISAAIESLEKIAKLAENDYATFDELAKLYKKKKNYAKELHYLEKYLLKAPVSDKTPIVKNRIDELRSIDLSKSEQPETEEAGLIDKIFDFLGKFKRKDT